LAGSALSAEQDARMALWLAKLALLSHGSTQAFNASGGQSGEPDDKMVTQVLRHDEPPHLTFHRRYAGARSDGAREQVIEAAGAAWDDWRRFDPDRKSESRSDDEFILEDGEGQTPERLAEHWNMLPRQIRNKRMQDGRDPETGYKITGDSSREARAAQLSRQGLTQAQIGVRLGISQQTVSNLLRNDRFQRGRQG
jgi:DNA-binding CsgD family transcriptional regulator